MSVHGTNVSDKSSTRGKRMMPRAFRAKTMPAALAAVEKALGTRALIVSVHPISNGPSWQLWRRSEVEVVAMPSAVDGLYPNPDEGDSTADPVQASAPLPMGESLPAVLSAAGKPDPYPAAGPAPRPGLNAGSDLPPP